MKSSSKRKRKHVVNKVFLDPKKEKEHKQNTSTRISFHLPDLSYGSPLENDRSSHGLKREQSEDITSLMEQNTVDMAYHFEQERKKQRHPSASSANTVAVKTESKIKREKSSSQSYTVLRKQPLLKLLQQSYQRQLLQEYQQQGALNGPDLDRLDTSAVRTNETVDAVLDATSELLLHVCCTGVAKSFQASSEGDSTDALEESYTDFLFSHSKFTPSTPLVITDKHIEDAWKWAWK